MLKKAIKKLIKIKKPINNYQFNIDAVSENRITGWVLNSAQLAKAVNVEVKSEGKLLWSSVANVFREDLKSKSIGNGKHGFVITPKLSSLTGKVNEIDIYFDGIKANKKSIPCIFIGTSKTIENGNIPNQVKNNINDEIQIHIDHISTEKIIGWAKRKDSTTHRVNVELKIGDVVLGAGKASSFRQSIKNAGIGDGCYCFEINPVVHLFTNENVTCDLYIDGHKVKTKAINLSVPTAEFEQAKYLHKYENELDTFSTAVKLEMERLKADVESNIDGVSNNATSVSLENIATLSVRVNQLEQILLKHFSIK
ncbi:hypothetical protein RGQ13_14345 [Thalassotalea psychrophila]|uniref:Uncharacterized protein n=1 Tax=Thalassotalea psychrophila TaxID=3065647 RepID=A0ABY9TR52_9GAMM|nr:hypothetical protein RGQ13_14345 [Colwelliaceae bacterium SQ149]